MSSGPGGNGETSIFNRRWTRWTPIWQGRVRAPRPRWQPDEPAAAHRSRAPPEFRSLTSAWRSSDQLAAFANDKRELIEETLRDALSGLYNRRGFDARFDEAMRQSRRAQTPLAILVLDLDHFKNYNDHFGHVAGDEALRAVAKTIGTSPTAARTCAAASAARSSR